ncbi:MAG: type VI secretion system tube protein Hcp [Pyrinomonadaceae bacterium]
MAIFIKIDGVEGESQKAGFEGQMESEAFSFGVSAPHAPEGSGHSGGQIHAHEAQFAVAEGRHSVEFWKKITTGTHFPTMIVSMTKQTGDGQQQVWKEYTFSSVYVTSVNSADSADGPSRQSLSVAADVFKVDYKAQDASGALKSVGSTEYNIRKAQTA